MQKHTIKSIAASYSNEINILNKINNKFLKLFGTKGSINVNYGLNRENCLDITYIEASAELPTKEHLPYCKAIHLCELREKLDALYHLFKKVSVEEKSTPQKIIDLIESNEEKDPRLNIAKTDIIFLFSLLSTNKSMMNFDIDYEDKELVIH